MIAYVENQGNQRIPWQFTAKMCINEAARFDATNVKTGLTTTERLERSTMANADLYRQGRNLSTSTNDEHAGRSHD
jgi:hypothetical protein